MTALFDAEQRSKRQLVKYNDIPPLMVQAVLAIEDRRFFEHSGVNFLRMAEAAWIDVVRGRHEQGGSTITMQLSRGFFLTPEKTSSASSSKCLSPRRWNRSSTKQQIFEFYANWVDLGQRGSFAISGFAEASQAYFNKDLKDITLPETALLAGLIQRPSYLSPYRHPERALERRNLVLESDGRHPRDHARAGGQSQGRAAEAGAAERGSQRRAVFRRHGARLAHQQVQ